MEEEEEEEEEQRERNSDPGPGRLSMHVQNKDTTWKRENSNWVQGLLKEIGIYAVVHWKELWKN